MFTYIKLKNFLSFGDVTFNFKKTANSPKKFVAIYGENGSGKSNFVKAFDLLLNTITSFSKASQFEKIKTTLEENKNDITADMIEKIITDSDIINHIFSCRTIDCDEPTEIEYGFLLNGHEGFYKISFSNGFTSESLYYLTGKQRGYLYKINENSDGSIQKKFWSGLFLTNTAKEEIDVEIDKYWGKHTLLGIFFNQINGKNLNYIKNNVSNNLLTVIQLLLDTTVISKQSNFSNTVFLSGKPNNLLINLKSGRIPKKDLPKLDRSERIIREFFTQIYADIKDVSYERKSIDDTIQYQLFVDKIISGKIRHINFNNESTGTQQVLDMVKMLLGLFCGVTVIYDEIDSGIHDILLNNILCSLIDEISGQLIITTHNTMLLEMVDTKYLYIIRTDYLGNKEVKCFDDFSLQNTNNARNKYLKGLFGGIPFVDGVDYDIIRNEIIDTKGAE